MLKNNNKLAISSLGADIAFTVDLDSDGNISNYKDATKFKLKKVVVFLGIIAALMFIYGSYGLIEWRMENINQSKIQVQTKQESKWSELPRQVQDKYSFLAIDFSNLLKRNQEVIGWLKVPNTNIDYPVLQTTNNDYYLTHDIDKKEAKSGSIFADCRSSFPELSFDTLIYGHNRLDKILFGQLLNLENGFPSPNDVFINFNTLTCKYVWQICSVYITDEDDDLYFNRNYSSEEAKRDFIKNLQANNTIPSIALKDLSTGDKYLTLSTCYGGAGTTKRFIVTARLVGEKQ